MKKTVILRCIAGLVTFFTAGWTLAGPQGDTGVLTANGWYEGEEIYYVVGQFENVPHQSHNQIFLIGGDRMYQGNVVQTIPGEKGYTPHWRVNLVHTAPGKTLDDIVNSPYVSEHYATEGVLFDDVGDIFGALFAGLITVEQPAQADGNPVIVLCPIISEQGAAAPGNTELPEVFPPFPSTF